MSQTYDLAVIGAGPGGYTAAFRAADLGLSVALIDPRETLGGTCLNIGCIPSKALLHIAKIRDDARDAAQHGLTFAEPQIDLGAIHRYRDGVVSKLTQGLRGLAKRRKVEVIRAKAHFLSPERLALISDTGESELHFRQAVIATGSAPIGLGFLPQDPRIIDSTGALALTSLPKHLVILGGGIIGLEMAQVYLSLGSQVTIIEQAPQLIPGTDAALVAPLAKRLTTRGVSLRLGCKVTTVTAEDDLAITLDTANGPEVLRADRLLVAVGRRPVTEDLNLAAAGLVAERGFLQVDAAMRTAQPHIFAIGDCVGQPMLAHKASHEGKVAAEAAAGHKVAFEAKVIPSVAYTDPEIAWVGLTETAAKASGQAYDIASFPWAASGRALTLGRDEGLTRLLIDPTTRRVIGAGITGPHAGDLIAEATLAIEMGADAADLALTIHPHPTLSESLGLAAEMLEGTITDLCP